MDRFALIKAKLAAIPDKEWQVIQKKSDKFITNKLWGKTASGAHSNKNLGMDATDYYFLETIKRIYNGQRDWKFEKNELLVQIFSIIQDLINDEVAKYKRKQAKKFPISITYLDTNELSQRFGNQADDICIDNNSYIENIDFIKAVIKGDNDLESLFLALDEGMKYDEICNEFGWEKQKLYKLAEKLKRKIITKRNKMYNK